MIIRPMHLKMKDIIKEASSGSCLRTRNEVTELLGKLLFTKEEAYIYEKKLN